MSMAASLNRQLKASRQQLNMLANSPALRSPTGYLDQKRNTLALLQNRMVSAQSRAVEQKHRKFAALTAKLDAMSPLKVLTRGYAMTQTESGEVVRSVKQINPGDKIKVTLSDGCLTAAVMDKEEHL